MRLKQGDPLASYSALLEKIAQLLTGRQNIKLTFLNVPFMSIEAWNRHKCHPDPSSFMESDRKLTSLINSMNEIIDSFNGRLETYTPKFAQDMIHSRKTKGRKTRYSIKFSLLLDGVHPGATLARSWLCSLCRKIAKECV